MRKNFSIVNKAGHRLTCFYNADGTVQVSGQDTYPTFEDFRKYLKEQGYMIEVEDEQ